jgi:hypothetical protein
VGALLSLFFLQKFLINFKVMPAGVMSGLRCVSVCCGLMVVCLLCINMERNWDCFKSFCQVGYILNIKSVSRVPEQPAQITCHD